MRECTWEIERVLTQESVNLSQRVCYSIVIYSIVIYSDSFEQYSHQFPAQIISKLLLDLINSCHRWVSMSQKFITYQDSQAHKTVLCEVGGRTATLPLRNQVVKTTESIGCVVKLLVVVCYWLQCCQISSLDAAVHHGKNLKTQMLAGASLSQWLAASCFPVACWRYYEVSWGWELVAVSIWPTSRACEDSLPDVLELNGWRIGDHEFLGAAASIQKMKANLWLRWSRFFASVVLFAEVVFVFIDADDVRIILLASKTKCRN